MRVLVTGASGFLGRSLVPTLLQRGHEVRAMLRPSTDPADLPWSDRVEIFRADLRVHREIEQSFEGVDALVHLAATVVGSDTAQFRGTVTGTERLLDAMSRTATRRVVLASSFAVYDWSATEGTLDETSPLEGNVYERNGYAVSKVWQERITRRLSDRHGWDLTVMRPGFIWGRGNEWLAGAGLRLGPVMMTMGARTELPLTHVENCADAFVTVLDHRRARGQTFNVVDGHSVTSWRYGRMYRRGMGHRAVPVVVPYRLGLTGTRLLSATVARTARRQPRLPGILAPRTYEVLFKPLRFSNDKLVRELGWRPPFSLKECLALTYGGSWDHAFGG